MNETPFFYPTLSRIDKMLPLIVMTIGSDSISSVSQTFAVNRSSGIIFDQILFTVQGETSVTINNKVYTATPNHIIFHKKHTPHSYCSASSNWLCYYITFLQKDYCNIFNFPSGVYPINSPSFFLSLHEEIQSQQNDLNFRTNSSVLLYNLLMSLTKSIVGDIDFSKQQQLEPVITYIHEHYREDIPLEQLAKILNVSTEHFCRLFKTAHGIRPIEFLQKTRMQNAKKLLIQNNDMSIHDISNYVGFRTTSYFIKQFKEYENITPSKYRQLYSSKK